MERALLATVGLGALLFAPACILVVRPGGDAEWVGWDEWEDCDRDAWGDGGEHRVGSGVEATESRELAGFDRIVAGSTVKVVVRVGGAQSVRVRADDDLVRRVRTSVEEGRLEVGMEKGSYRTELGIEVRVEVPRLAGLEVGGGAEAEVSGLDADRFELEVSGGGDATVAGRVDRLVVRVSGAGEASLDGLAARSAEVEVSGAGEALLRVEEDLTATAGGAGSIAYAGEPARTKLRTSGAGSIDSR